MRALPSPYLAMPQACIGTALDMDEGILEARVNGMMQVWKVWEVWEV